METLLCAIGGKDLRVVVTSREGTQPSSWKVGPSRLNSNTCIKLARQTAIANLTEPS